LARIDAIRDHDAAERATNRHFFNTGCNRFINTIEIDACAKFLFLPHSRSTSTATE
jgi:hypothetical protein